MTLLLNLIIKMLPDICNILTTLISFIINILCLIISIKYKEDNVEGAYYLTIATSLFITFQILGNFYIFFYKFDIFKSIFSIIMLIIILIIFITYIVFMVKILILLLNNNNDSYINKILLGYMANSVFIVTLTVMAKILIYFIIKKKKYTAVNLIA